MTTDIRAALEGAMADEREVVVAVGDWMVRGCIVAMTLRVVTLVSSGMRGESVPLALVARVVPLARASSLALAHVSTLRRARAALARAKGGDR